MNISRNHARIFYDFTRRRFALEVLGKNGCLVEGVLHLPGNPPVKLDSQDLLQIGDKEFYFLLPVRSILGGGPIGPIGPRHYVNSSHHGHGHGYHGGGGGGGVPNSSHYGYHHNVGGSGNASGVKKGRREYYDDDDEEYEDEDGDEDGDVGGNGNGNGSSGKKMRRDGYDGYGYGSSGGKASHSGVLNFDSCLDYNMMEIIFDQNQPLYKIATP